MLTGARQTGKSSLLKKIFPNYNYVTLYKVAIAEEAEVNPSSFLSKFSGPTIIDEVQYAPGIFK